MPRRSPLNDDMPRMDIEAIDQLVGLHVQEHLRLAWKVGLFANQAHFNGSSPAETVTELLRLARLGAIAEHEARDHPDRPLSVLIATARERWRIEVGVR